MDEILDKEIIDELDKAIAEGEKDNINEQAIVEDNKKDVEKDIEDKKNNDANKIYIKLDPVENIGDCLALSVEGSQIHHLMLHFIRMDNTFSLELRDTTPEESAKIFADVCIKICKKRSLLEPYIEKVITTILEDESFNYSKKLPRLLLMASYYKKKKDANDDIKYYKLVELDEEGYHAISENFEKLVKKQTLKNVDFIFEFIVDLWVKRMMEETCFEVLKKKIQKFMKTRDCMESLKIQLEDYLKHQEQLMKEKEALRQHASSKHIR